MTLKNVFSTSTHFLHKHRLMLVPLFFGIFIPLLVFGKLAEEVWEHEGFDWDIPILHFIHRFATPVRDNLMVLITDAGGIKVMVPVAGAIFLMLLLRRRQGHALFFSLAIGGAAVLNFLAKLFFRRTRPHLWISPVSEHDYGFPSGHAMGSMAVITALVILTWSTRWRWPILIFGSLFVLAVGLSRLYLGVHFPSDIMAGWVASLAWVMGVYMILSNRFWPGVK